MGKEKGTVYEVSKNIDNFVIDPFSKNLPGEIQFLGVARVGKQIIAQIIRVEALVKVIIIGPDNITP